MLPMNKIVLAGVFLVLGFSPARKPEWFSGRIIYRNEFQSLAGEMLDSSLGTESWIYFQANNYKVYAQNRQLRELYLGKTCAHQLVKEGKASPIADTATSQTALVIKELPARVTILGYPCRAVQVVSGSVASTIYFSDKLRVDPAGFRKCPADNWSRILQATKGALPLRTISVESKRAFTATQEATSVQPLLLGATDFNVNSPAE